MGSGRPWWPGRKQVCLGESASTSKANFDQSLHGATLPVGSYPSTGYGLFEIGGNLREWTWDSNETTTDGNSSQNLVDEENSTAFFVPEVKGYQPFFGNDFSTSSVQSFAVPVRKSSLISVVVSRCMKSKMKHITIMAISDTGNPKLNFITAIIPQLFC